MTRRLVFRATSPLGYTVVLTRDRWREIVRFKHPALAGQERLVQQCIRQPQVVRESVHDPDVHLHYAGASRGYLCVVVRPRDDQERLVVTAYFTREIKQGNEIWKK